MCMRTLRLAVCVMAWPILSAMMILALVESSYGDKVYFLSSYPDEQEGATLSGDITVSDTAVDDGLLENDEILSWSFTVSNDSDTMTGNSEDSPSFTPISSGVLNITGTQISIPSGDVSGANSISLVTAPNGSVNWFRGFSPGVGTYTDWYFGGKDGSLFWDLLQLPPTPTTLGGTDPWVIATTVPGSSLPGDYNGSGAVEQADLDLVLLNWDATWTPEIPGWDNDQPGNGLIDQGELEAVRTNWGDTLAAPASLAVPEPSTVMQLIGAMLPLVMVGMHAARFRAT